MGRQNGVVNCYQIHPAALSRRRFIKMVDSASVTGEFTKVPTKPTNQSKFTGKCRRSRCNGCHIHPVCKSRDKAKGAMKLRSIDPENKLTKYFSGNSVTGVLAYLADESGYNDDEYDYQGTVEENYDYAYGYGHAYDDHDYDHHDDDDGSHNNNIDLGIGFGIVIKEHENHIDVGEIDVEDDDDDDDDNDDDDNMSFCDVGLCWGHGDGDEYGDDDGWYLVGGHM